MKIENLKVLQQVIKLCRKEGVSTIEIDNVKLTLQPQTSKTRIQAPDIANDFPEARLQVPKFTGFTPSEDDKIVTDELTEEQLLNWSSAPSNNTGVEQ